MQLNLTTDYAIRTVLYLAEHGSLANSAEISDAMKIPQNYLVILTKKLRHAGILRAQRGNTGGYMLAAKPEDITIFDVISAMEDTTRVNRCLESDRYCSCNATDSCPVYTYFGDLQQELDNSMKSMTIAKLLEMKS